MNRTQLEKLYSSDEVIPLEDEFSNSSTKIQKKSLVRGGWPQEWKNRTQLEKFYSFDEVIPLEDGFSTKSRTAIDNNQSVKISQLYD